MHLLPIHLLHLLLPGPGLRPLLTRVLEHPDLVEEAAPPGHHADDDEDDQANDSSNDALKKV